MVSIIQNNPEEAEKWFIKAEKAGTLDAPAACEYGMLQYLEKGDWETGLKYLYLSADQIMNWLMVSWEQCFTLRRTRLKKLKNGIKRQRKQRLLPHPMRMNMGSF